MYEIYNNSKFCYRIFRVCTILKYVFIIHLSKKRRSSIRFVGTFFDFICKKIQDISFSTGRTRSNNTVEIVGLGDF